MLRRGLLEKKHKTLDATGRLLKAAEIKKRRALEDAKQTAKLQKVRKTFWVCTRVWGGGGGWGMEGDSTMCDVRCLLSA